MAEREGWEKLGGRAERSGVFGIKEAKKERKSCLPAWRRGEVRKYYPENTIVFGIIDTDGYRANNRRCFNFSSAVAYVQYPSAMAQSQQTRYKPVKFGIVSVYARVAGENFSPEAK